MTNHTKGPWSIEKYGAIVDCNGETISMLRVTFNVYPLDAIASAAG